MRLSIITPTYNQGSFISQAIQSILNQDPHLDLEYIIIDGGSTDTTKDVVEQYRPQIAARKILFTFISEPDEGQSDAINKGVRVATGQLLGVLCSDDFFEPGILKKVVDAFTANPKALWGYGGWQFVDYDRQVFSTTQPSVYSFRKLQVLCNIGMPSCFYRKDLLIAIGFVNPTLHLSMDYDMWFRMARVADPIILPFVVSDMRYYGQTKSGTKTLAHLRESFQLQRKYTKGFLTRIRQYWYFFRGLVMIFLRRDVTTRVEKWRQRRLRRDQ